MIVVGSCYFLLTLLIPYDQNIDLFFPLTMFFLMELCSLMCVVAYNFIFLQTGSLSAYTFGIKHYVYISYMVLCSLMGCILQIRMPGYKVTTIIEILRE